MRVAFIRRSLMLAAIAVVAAAMSACQRESEGLVQVIALGDTPRLVDPDGGTLTAGEAILIDSAAQGLVRFDARGQIEPALAETWNVSDDGLSYIFRLANGTWANGRKVTAEQVARLLRRHVGQSSRNPLKDAFAAVDDIVAMTDRVLEIRLNQPRPNLLQLLAQPEMGLVHEGQGTGPFFIDRRKSRDGVIRLTREVATADEEQAERQEVGLSGARPADAIRAFAAGKADLVLGGTFADLPLAQRSKLPRRALQFDPASGLFGLIPLRASGPLSDPEMRRLLSEAIDRDGLVAEFAVPGLAPRATVLEPSLDNIPDPVPPQWAATPLAERLPALTAAARRFMTDGVAPTVRIALPEGPGAEMLLQRLKRDWGVLGLSVERASRGQPADLRLVDEVAPSTSPAWFLRHFHCTAAAICEPRIDELLDAARTTPVAAQRSALLNEAAQRIDELQLFIPIAAPIRWSLVGPRIAGFSGNRFAIHTLTGLEQRLDRTGE